MTRDNFIMKRFISENKQLLALALPLIINYIIEACPNFINNAMIAHLGPQALAAGAIVSTSFSSLLLFFYGILVAASTLISHYHGAKETRSIGFVVRDASILALIGSAIMLIIMSFAPVLLHLAGQSPALIAIAMPYVHGLMLAVIPDFISMVFWQLFLGIGKPKVTLISSLSYVPINLIVNYALVFGHFGLPKLGMLGIGLGTAIGYSLLAIGLGIYILYHPHYRGYFKRGPAKTNVWHIKSLLRIGFPMGAMWTIDQSFFTVAAFLAGMLSVSLLAAQQIAMQITSLIMMTVAGLTQAISIRLGHIWGAKDYQYAPMIGITGIINTLLLTLIGSLVLWLWPLRIIGIDFDIHNPANLNIIEDAKPLLFIFGFYLLANALRFAAFALLRALKDTYFPAFCSLLGFYGVALGLGYPLLFYWHLSINAFWLLATCVVFIMALLMLWRFRWYLRKYL